MKLERIKNTNAMTATEMAMVLGGQQYCTTGTGGGYTRSTGNSYSCDAKVYDNRTLIAESRDTNTNDSVDAAMGNVKNSVMKFDSKATFVDCTR